MKRQKALEMLKEGFDFADCLTVNILVIIYERKKKAWNMDFTLLD